MIVNNLSMNIVRLSRIIHPVGQGAFYTERFFDSDGNTLYTIVYDCGSSPKSFVNNEIHSFFVQDDVVDILFLSHFDKDHISGLDELKKVCEINTVIMPLLNSVQKMYMLSQGINKMLITDPKRYFDSSRIVYVSPISSESKDERDYSDLGQELNSGTRIHIPKECSWVYVPFNYDSNARQDFFLEKFKKIDELKNVDFDNDEEVNQIVLNADVKLISKLNKVFRGSMSDGANRVSMLLYSGPLHSGGSILSDIEVHFNNWYEVEGKLNVSSAALYLGDTDLNQDGLLTELRLQLDQLSHNIGMIQLPHHGSKRNFSRELSKFCEQSKVCLYFASFGTDNRFGHPSSSVVEQVVLNNGKFVGVTEKRDSMLLGKYIKQ